MAQLVPPPATLVTAPSVAEKSPASSPTRAMLLPRVKVMGAVTMNLPGAEEYPGPDQRQFERDVPRQIARQQRTPRQGQRHQDAEQRGGAFGLDHRKTSCPSKPGSTPAGSQPRVVS